MTSEQQRDRLRWKQKPFPELVRLAWPIGVSTLSYSVMTLVDTLFVGRLGAAALAGVSVGGIMAFTLLCFGFGQMRSVKVLVSQAVGAGKVHRTSSYLGAGIFIAVALGVANIAAGWLLSGHIEHITSSAASAQHAGAYLDVRVVSAPMFLVAVALRQARYGTGDVKTPMRAAIVANLVNIALDYLLIVELGHGVRGAAWASVAAACVDFGWLARAQWREGYGLNAAGLSQVREVWSLGAPIGLQMLLEVSAFMLLTAIFASMSEVDVAAHQIALQVAHFSFLPAYSLGEAASVMVGQAVGAGDDSVVRKVARKAMLAAGIYTGACGVLFVVAAEPIAAAFTDDGELIRTTASVLYVAAAFQVFDGANIVARSVLRGTGDVRYCAVVSVAIAWVVTPPMAIGLGYGLGLGVVGGWAGLCVEIIAGAAVLWWRLERGGWRAAARRQRAQLARSELSASKEASEEAKEAELQPA